MLATSHGWPEQLPDCPTSVHLTRADGTCGLPDDSRLIKPSTQPTSVNAVNVLAASSTPSPEKRTVKNARDRIDQDVPPALACPARLQSLHVYTHHAASLVWRLHRKKQALWLSVNDCPVLPTACMNAVRVANAGVEVDRSALMDTRFG
jgi:hypothetical protein